MDAKKIFSFSIFIFTFYLPVSFAQQKKDSAFKKTSQDTAARKNILALDSTSKKHNPKIATFRSAVLPGWGQAYNKKYWKIPIIYGALGTTAGIFFYNLKTYKLLRQAVIYRSDTITSNDALVDPRFINLSTESIRRNRNAFRQNVDYSVLFFIIFWGLNVVDATVDAHLKSFDVSNDISLKIKPGYNNINNTAGITFIFSFKDKNSKGLPSF
ncbi:MAG: DUF5683 domain-containing protein [Bacteroidota bacterium]|nr:DUF5683 domain-containing protein [Bacteroidota bacterium]